MKRIACAALLGAAGLVAAGVTAGEPAKADAKLSKQDVAKLMKETHTGAKSPHARTVEELRKEAPNWEQVAKDAKAFAAMAEAFGKTDLGYYSPAKYVEGSTALTKAAGAKDKKAATAAFDVLAKSCSACHAYK